MRAVLPLVLVAAVVAAACVAIAKASQPHRAHDLAWWRARAHANRRLYRVEHHRWQLERAHRLRDKRARTVQARTAPATDWRAKQIAAAEAIGHEALSAGRPDPWPNCADPIRDGAASWDVTVACENSGSWLDSPGYYRCGLQFDPMWEQRFGALCP